MVSVRQAILIILLVSSITMIQRVLSGGHVYWDPSRRVLESDEISMSLSPRKPRYVLWHKAEQKVRYFFEIERISEFVDVNGNGMLDLDTERLVDASLESGGWRLHNRRHKRNNIVVEEIEMSAEIQIHERWGRRRAAEISISSIMSNDDVQWDKGTLHALHEIRITLNISKWPWNTDTSLLQVSISYGVEEGTANIISIAEGMESKNIEISGDGLSMMYINISETIQIDGEETNTTINLSEGSIRITLTHFTNNAVLDFTLGIIVPEAATSFSKNEDIAITCFIILVATIATLKIIASRHKIEHISKIVA